MSKSLPIASSIIDIERDELLTLAQATREVPGRDSTNPHTLFRWHKYGARGFRLETVSIGRKLFTTRAALFVYLDVSSRQSAEVIRTCRKTAKKASRKQAKRVLNRAGV